MFRSPQNSTTVAIPHKTSLSNSEWCNFLILIDPERGLPESWEGSIPSKYLKAADIHGLLPIVLRKLTGNSSPTTPIHHDGDFSDLINKSEISVGLTMLLQHHCKAIEFQIKEQGLRAVVVKGPVFAETIYKNSDDRIFSDIDLLAHPNDIDNVGIVLAEAGFRRSKKDFWDRSDIYQEQKWFLSGNSNVMIELHGNLVHYPSLRRRASFGYKEYQIASRAGEAYPLALFMTAVVHASLGHKFHKLQLLVDIVQAFRHLSDDHLKQLPDVAEALSLRLETALCLKLIANIFSEDYAAELATRIALPVQSAIANYLVSPEVLLVTSGNSRLRRHAFRWLQSLHLGR